MRKLQDEHHSGLKASTEQLSPSTLNLSASMMSDEEDSSDLEVA